MGLFISLEDYMTPHGDGYVYFPSAGSGGKFISRAEFEQLDARYRAMWRRLWWVAPVLFALVFLVGAATLALRVPPWIGVLAAITAGAGWSGWWLQPGLAPWRLVRHREAIVPPRDRAEARRAGRRRLSWAWLGLASMLLVVVFARLLLVEPHGPYRTAMLVGYGVLIALLGRVAVGKLLDRRR